MTISVIILSKTTSIEEYKTTLNCLNSLLNSESSNKINFQIILIESYAKYIKLGIKYPEYVKVIVPNCNFNYNQFLNIGIKKSCGDFLVLCNNDIIFRKGWMTNILEIYYKHPKILSFCPIDLNNQLTKSINHEKGFIKGYAIKIHVSGWCIVVKKEIFNFIGSLDESFDFYYADNDYVMTLRKNNLDHALVLSSEVSHIGGYSSSHFRMITTKTNEKQINYIVKFKKMFSSKYRNLPENPKMREGYLKFHDKWGSPNTILFKNFYYRITKQIKKLNLMNSLYSFYLI